MKRKGVRGEARRFGHPAGWHPLRSGLHEQAENIQTIVLSERAQDRNGSVVFHTSTAIELLAWRQGIFRYELK
jgi:hypothetical protein